MKFNTQNAKIEAIILWKKRWYLEFMSEARSTILRKFGYREIEY